MIAIAMFKRPFVCPMAPARQIPLFAVTKTIKERLLPLILFPTTTLLYESRCSPFCYALSIRVLALVVYTAMPISVIHTMNQKKLRWTSLSQESRFFLFLEARCKELSNPGPPLLFDRRAPNTTTRLLQKRVQLFFLAF